ncbi:MAG: transcriptional regulator [Sphingomonadales bacterium CG12_big_fil_rev_8_21_14_0_65_65_10]|nr:MAG: transcriptional regulator [Sphingomonadales bacterium CG12_big_fil_rev_8_21_14_0_65_65_10]
MSESASLFDDGKDPQALRTIGEVSNALGIKPHVLRYWEEQFPMLKPTTRAGGRRYYRAEDIALVRRIDDLVNAQGYTLKGAKKALAKKVEPVGEAIAAPHPQQPDERPGTPAPALVPQLRAIRDRLAAALQH